MIANRLTVKDYLIVEEADVALNSKLNMFLGKNKQGKTTLIKALRSCLGGTLTPDMIRHGADEARLMVDLGEFLVNSSITKAGKKTVKITNQAGNMEVKRPAEFLKSLLGDFTFDPIAFVLMEGKERKKYLMELFNPKVRVEQLEPLIDAEILDRIKDNLDKMDGLSVLKNLEDIYYARRTDKNKQLAQKKALYAESVPKGYDPDTAFDETEIAALTDMLKTVEKDRDAAKDIEKQNENAEKMRAIIGKKIAEYREIAEGVSQEKIDLIPEYEKAIASYEEIIKDLESKIAQQKALRDDIKATHEVAVQHQRIKEEALAAIQEQETSLNDFPLQPVPNTEGMEGKIADLDAKILEAKGKKDLRDKYLQAQDIKKAVDELEMASESLTVIIEKLRKDIPAEIIKEANIPIEDLRIDGDKVLIGETSVDNMSTSEQVRIALTIVRALNKEASLKLLCLDRAESLDDDTLKEFRDQIGEDEFQYVLTYVQHGEERPEGSILVEKGEVKA